jgi:hypothetical protein
MRLVPLEAHLPVEMNAQGAITMLTRALARIGRWEDAAALDAFVASDSFGEAFALVAPTRRATIMRAYAEAQQRCSLRKPVRWSCRQGRTSWTPERIAELRTTARRHTCNTLRIARDMGISVGAAERAMRRNGLLQRR